MGEGRARRSNMIIARPVPCLFLLFFLSCLLFFFSARDLARCKLRKKQRKTGILITGHFFLSLSLFFSPRTSRPLRGSHRIAHPCLSRDKSNPTPRGPAGVSSLELVRAVKSAYYNAPFGIFLHPLRAVMISFQSRMVPNSD